MDNNNNNIFKLVPSNEEKKYIYEVTYIDGVVEQIESDYFGLSTENPNFIIFGVGEEDTTPPIIIRSDQIRKVVPKVIQGF